MSIQTLRTTTADTSTGSNGTGRKVAGLLSSLALAVVVAGGVVINLSHQQARSTPAAGVASGQTFHSSEQVDTLGGVAERVQYHRATESPAQLAAHLAQLEPEDWAVPRTLSSRAAAQAGMMGRVAERITLQAQALAPPTGDGWACGTTPQRTAC